MEREYIFVLPTSCHTDPWTNKNRLVGRCTSNSVLHTVGLPILWGNYSIYYTLFGRPFPLLGYDYWFLIFYPSPAGSLCFYESSPHYTYLLYLSCSEVYLMNLIGLLEVFLFIYFLPTFLCRFGWILYPISYWIFILLTYGYLYIYIHLPCPIYIPSNLILIVINNSCLVNCWLPHLSSLLNTMWLICNYILFPILASKVCIFFLTPVVSLGGFRPQRVISHFMILP